ncbi:MAG: class B sortase [Bacilli bacterium]
MKKIKRKFKKRLIFPITLLIISVSLIIISLTLIIRWKIDNENVKNLGKDLEQNASPTEIIDTPNTEMVNPPEEHKKDDYLDFIKVPLLNVDFSSLLNKNKDTVAWIQVNGTNINYPIVQTDNNEYYLTHAFDRSNNGAGWLFADSRNNMKDFDKNTIIYGHGRLNYTMFGTLKRILTSSWQKEKNNQVIRLSTEKENTSWQVFSVYTIPSESYYITTLFPTDKDYQEFLNTISSRSEYKYNVSLNTKDLILTLSSCNINDNNKRIVLHAKLIKRQVK